MGMYDDITIKQNLPLPEELKTLNKNWSEYRFQTKDLDNCLLQYFIENDCLYEQVVEREYIEFTEEEKKQRKKKKEFLPIWKDVIETASYSKKIEDFHGTLFFYTYDEFDETEDYWVEFKAYFVYGKLDKIELHEFKKETSRKFSLKDWKEKLEKTNAHPWTIFKKYASYLGWRWFWKKVADSLYITGNLFQDARTFVFKYFL